MTEKKYADYEAVNNFIIAIKCCAIDEINRNLQEYESNIVNKLESQTRQPSLYFAAILIDHQQSYQIMKLLLKHGANAHFKDNYQQTVLFYVCREGKQKCLELLLSEGLSLDDEDTYGQTPLFYVAKENRLNIIHKLIQKKVDLNHIDKIANQTALFYSAREGNLQMCKILVEAGSDITILDSNHKTAAHYAKKYNKNQLFEYLSAQFQTLKDQKKILGDSNAFDSNQEQKYTKGKKKRQTIIGGPAQNKTTYRLYRSDGLGNVTELSMMDFQEWIQNYPQLQDMFRSPDYIDLSNIEQIKAKDSWQKFAHRVLSLCWKAKGAYFFHQPVDPSKFGIDDYFDVILEPMDFGTVKKKLAHNVYNNVTQFIYDMKLVFDNCVKYNGTQNQIAKYAIEIKNLFQENMKQTGFMN